MVDPVEFGELRAQVQHVQKSNEELRNDIKELQQQIQELLDLVNTAKGGWRTLAAVTGAAATLGAGVQWVFEHLSR